MDLRLVWIVLKASITSLIVYIIISALSILMSWLSERFFGVYWFKDYLQLIHESFTLVIFFISCVKDLISYLEETYNISDAKKNKRREQKNNKLIYKI